MEPELHDAPAPTTDPLARFGDAFARALWRTPEAANACVLSTVGADGGPSSRVVLLKRFDPRGFEFFTNLLSRKAQELRTNPRVALNFHWPELGEQVRVEGVAEGVSEAESRGYFATRPRLSQLGAWASEQSQELASREELDARLASVEREFDGRPVPCPPHWGGVRVVPSRIEFWTSRAHRLHDRDVYVRKGDRWSLGHLYP